MAPKNEPKKRSAAGAAEKASDNATLDGTRKRLKISYITADVINSAIDQAIEAKDAKEQQDFLNQAIAESKELWSNLLKIKDEKDTVHVQAKALMEARLKKDKAELTAIELGHLRLLHVNDLSTEIARKMGSDYQEDEVRDGAIKKWSAGALEWSAKQKFGGPYHNAARLLSPPEDSDGEAEEDDS